MIFFQSLKVMSCNQCRCYVAILQACLSYCRSQHGHMIQCWLAVTTCLWVLKSQSMILTDCQRAYCGWSSSENLQKMLYYWSNLNSYKKEIWRAWNYAHNMKYPVANIGSSQSCRAVKQRCKNNRFWQAWYLATSSDRAIWVPTLAKKRF